MNVTLCIPSVPPRARLLREAVASAVAQDAPFAGIHVEVDLERTGPAATRNRSVRAAQTDWVAFLDDDDLLRPHHLSTLIERQRETDADLVYPWFQLEVMGQPSERKPIFITQADGSQTDPEGAEPDLAALDVANYIPVTVLVRRDLLLDVGGFQPPWQNAVCEDWGAWIALRSAGAKFAHANSRTWVWRHHGGNYGGRAW